jgi:hypothetical protein
VVCYQSSPYLRCWNHLPSLSIAYRPRHLLLCTVLRTSEEVDEAGGHWCWLLSSYAREQHRGLSPRRLPFCTCAASHTPPPRTTSPLRLPHFASALSLTPRQLSSTTRRRSPSLLSIAGHERACPRPARALFFLARRPPRSQAHGRALRLARLSLTPSRCERRLGHVHPTPQLRLEQTAEATPLLG